MLEHSMAQVQYQPDGRSGAGMKRQATWDALPDIDLFSIPVDDFFGDYVEQLGARGLQQDVSMNGGSFGSVLEHYPHNGTQQMNGLLPPIPGPADQLNMNSIPSFNEHDLPGLNGVTTLEPLPEDDAMGTVITSGFDSTLDHKRSNSGSQQGSGNLGQAVREVGRAGSNNSARDNNSHSHDESPDGDDTGSPVFRNGVGSKRGGIKTKRNARQQDQNKQAQQRYRERRKQKFNEMEESLHALESQVEQLNSVQSQNNMLQGRAVELEGRLRDKELEVEQLRKALAQAGVKQETVASPDDHGKYNVIKMSECNNVRAHMEKKREEELAGLQHDFTLKKEKLRSLVEQYNLRDADPLGKGVDPKVVERVRETMMACSLKCQNAMRAEGIKVLALFSQDVSSMANIKCSVQTAKWRRILDMLRLSSAQEEQLLQLRKKHLRNLRNLYEDRQRLNLSAMSLMLPKNTPRRQLPDEATLESRMDCMKVTSSYSCAALNNVNLDAILDDIKCNLRKEQHTVLELNWHVLYHVLAPIQAALLTVEAFPGHCDCLALVNILAMKVGGPQAQPFDAEHHPTSSEEKSETCCE
ncbi:g12609 [Coccomyxa viridis]|uniref:G12609 protein n=1 Tax=Coccomyxa viridis TaxID=1274662 RepID=A0ABP1GDF5_9CHLO